jgi:hypothetical protein
MAFCEFSAIGAQSGPKADRSSRLSERYSDNKRVNLRLFKVCKTFMRRFDPGPRLQSFNNLRHNCFNLRTALYPKLYPVKTRLPVALVARSYTRQPIRRHSRAAHFERLATAESWGVPLPRRIFQPGAQPGYMPAQAFSLGPGTAHFERPPRFGGEPQFWGFGLGAGDRDPPAQLR